MVTVFRGYQTAGKCNTSLQIGRYSNFGEVHTVSLSNFTWQYANIKPYTNKQNQGGNTHTFKLISNAIFMVMYYQSLT